MKTEDGHEFYLVVPDNPSGPAVMFLHWFDEAPNANRSQFLGEAEDLATRGVVSVLPQLTFPWHEPPTDTERDLTRIEAEVSWLEAAHSALCKVDGVDRSRFALVGHDFGAMHGLLLLRDVDAAGAVLIAPTARWADWFLPFWPIASDRYDYMRALEPVDPITVISGARTPLLFQFGERDFYIAAMTGLGLMRAAPEPKTLLSYDTGHAMDLDRIRADRLDWLSEVLDLGAGGETLP